MWQYCRLTSAALTAARVGFHRALILRDQRYLGVERLARHRVLRGETLIARQIDLSALQQRLVAHQIAVGLRQRRLIRTRVNFRDQIAFLDLIAFLEIDLQQIATDLAADRHGRKRGHSAQRIEVDSDVALADGLGNDRHRGGVAPAAPLAFGRGLLLVHQTMPATTRAARGMSRQSAMPSATWAVRRMVRRVLRFDPRRRFLGRFDGLIHEPSITEFSFIRGPLCCVAGRA